MFLLPLLFFFFFKSTSIKISFQDSICLTLTLVIKHFILVKIMTFDAAVVNVIKLNLCHKSMSVLFYHEYSYITEKQVIYSKTHSRRLKYPKLRPVYTEMATNQKSQLLKLNQMTRLTEKRQNSQHYHYHGAPWESFHRLYSLANLRRQPLASLLVS